jgi:hypothetical protein
MVPSRQFLTLVEGSRQISIVDSIALVERSVRARVGPVELAGEPDRGCLGLERAGRLVGGAHLRPDCRGHLIGQLGLGIPDLVELAAGHDRAVEHRLDR